MTRKEKLTENIINVLGNDNQGSPGTRQYRIFTMIRIVHDLFAIRIILQNWHMLGTEDVHALVKFWKKKNLKNSTMMNYLVALRYFLKRINHRIDNIENSNLYLSKPRNNIRPVVDENALLDAISEPLAWLLFALQSRFGLTFLEAMYIKPAIHIRDNGLWITREISTNNKDRLIPVISREQQAILEKLNTLISGNRSLSEQFGERHLRLAWKFALSTLQLPTNMNYRYLYARARLAQLCRETSKKEARVIVISETGITNTSPLWKNLYE